MAPLKLSPDGLAFLKEQEGLRLDAYECSAGVWTIGYGHTGPDPRSGRGQAVEPGTRVTQAGAEDLLRRDVERFEWAVACRADAGDWVLNGPQFDALVSLAFNIGAHAFAKQSSVARLLDDGDVRGAADAFLLWNKTRDKDGKLVVSPGLQARRKRERALFLTPTATPPEETTMAAPSLNSAKPWFASRTVWGGLVAAVCGLLPLLGLDVDAGTQGAIADVAVQSVGVAGAVAAIVFRVKADKKLIGSRPESGRGPERQRVGR